jgi:membrane protein required for colicin V production
MIMLDYLLIGVVAVSALMGLLRGFAKEAVSLTGWIVAIWGAWRFADPVQERLPELLNDPVISLWIARLIILIGVLFAAGIISRLISYLLNMTGLSSTNRTIGMLFGLARGVVLVGLAVKVMQATGFEADPWWQESKLIPYAVPLAQRLTDIAEEGMDMLDEPVESALPLADPL